MTYAVTFCEMLNSKDMMFIKYHTHERTHTRVFSIVDT